MKKFKLKLLLYIAKSVVNESMTPAELVIIKQAIEIIKAKIKGI